MRLLRSNYHIGGRGDSVRNVPYDINEKLKSRIQTKATNADPKLSFWISRKTTQLTDSVFLESSNVAVGNITDCSVAVRHMKFGFESDTIFIAYVQNGKAKIASSPVFTEISRHTWTDSGFEQSAEAVAIAFGGTMPKDTQGRYEFITEAAPWIFWISNGAVYGQKLGGNTLTLATQNVTDISAVRAMWSDVPGFDFGLVLFMVVNGSILYRQLIGGVWSDAETIPASALPSGKTWTKISAQRTWDYRISLQTVANDGSLYEVFTQFGGIGSKGAERIELKNINADSGIIEVNYKNASESEHIEIGNLTAFGKHRLNIAPVPVDVINMQNSSGKWNTLIKVTLSYPVSAESVQGNESAFVLSNSGRTYACSKVESSTDGLSLTLNMASFLSSIGECSLSYSPGTITSDALDMAAWTFKFTPVNLNPVNAYDFENIEMTSIDAACILIDIGYVDTVCSERVEISGMAALGILTHINDI